jgi:hypothetical protein
VGRGQLLIQVGATHAEVCHLHAPLGQQLVRSGEGLPLLVQLRPETFFLAKVLGLGPGPLLQLLK